LAKRRDSLYRPGDRGGWVNVKNRAGSKRQTIASRSNRERLACQST